MKITEGDGLHYCQDCDHLTIDTNYEFIWYCSTHAKHRGWNIINGKRVKIAKDACCYNPIINEAGECKTCKKVKV